jgi:DNA-directed RNA polymerase specialized sigma subunit
LIQKYLSDQSEVERKAERNYNIHNISLEFLEAANVSVEGNLKKVQEGDLLDEVLKDSSQYGLLEIVENEHLFMALKELKEIDLTILNLRYQQNLLLKEISQVLEKDMSTISRHIDSSLKRIKENLESQK